MTGYVIDSEFVKRNSVKINGVPYESSDSNASSDEADSPRFRGNFWYYY